eukprot:2583977-Ditylum_brightwellii.AAC.1
MVPPDGARTQTNSDTDEYLPYHGKKTDKTAFFVFFLLVSPTEPPNQTASHYKSYPTNLTQRNNTRSSTAPT